MTAPTTLPTRSREGRFAVAGLALLLAGVLTVVLIFKTFSGDFGDHIRVTADVAHVGDSLDRDDIVTYRDVIIGKVTSFRASGDGGATLTLRIEGEHAGDLPAGVTAVAVPASLFGNTKIVLVAPKDTAGPTLHDGSSVAADTSPSASGLQTALSDLYTLLTAIKPSQLNSALTALAQALEGRGDDIGRLIDRTATFLRTVSPALPDIQRAITSFATVTEELARDTPDLLASLSNSLVPAAAIVRQRSAIRELLAVGPAAADRARRLVQRVGDDTVTVITNAQPVLAALAERPRALADTVTGFRSVAQALNTVFHGGRASANVLVTAVNSSSLVPVLLGQKTDVIDALAKPRGYTAADCPTYPGASGPNCTTLRSARGPVAAVQANSSTVSLLVGPVLRAGAAR